jgi:hypothetical protein
VLGIVLVCVSVGISFYGIYCIVEKELRWRKWNKMDEEAE